MDYPCAKFGNFTFSRFIVRTDRHTEAHDRYTHATTVYVSKNYNTIHASFSHCVCTKRYLNTLFEDNYSSSAGNETKTKSEPSNNVVLATGHHDKRREQIRSNLLSTAINYRAANSIFGKIGRVASEEVVLQLIKSKCVPVLLYGLEACSFVLTTNPRSPHLIMS